MNDSSSTDVDEAAQILFQLARESTMRVPTYKQFNEYLKTLLAKQTVAAELRGATAMALKIAEQHFEGEYKEKFIAFVNKSHAESLAQLTKEVQL